MALRGVFDVGRTAIGAEVSVIVHLENLDRCIRVACVCLLPFLLVTHHIFLIVAFLIVCVYSILILTFSNRIFFQLILRTLALVITPSPFYHTTTLSPVLRCDCPYRN